MAIESIDDIIERTYPGAHDWAAHLESDRVGHPRTFNSPKELWKWAVMYFKSIDDNPIRRKKIYLSGPKIGKEYVEISRRPYTWQGFEAFLFLNNKAAQLDHYRVNTGGQYARYKKVIAAIKNIMFENKFDGAAVGDFKEGLITKILGLTDSAGVTINAPGGGENAGPTINVYNTAPPLAASENDIDLNKQ